ncbi:MAG: nucleoside hydrolase, partial [Romboutsia sp.]
DNLPIKRELITAQDTHGIDGLGEILQEIELPENIIKGNAIDYILKTLNEDDQISIIALGPLTNLAKVVKQDSNVLNKAKKIISMGGAFQTNG